MERRHADEARGSGREWDQRYRAEMKMKPFRERESSRATTEATGIEMSRSI